MAGRRNGRAVSCLVINGERNGHRRSDLGCVFEWWEHAASARGFGAAAERGPLIQGCGVAPGGRLSEDFNAWRERDLSGEDIRYIFLDGWYPKVRIGKKRERVPVLVILGVRSDGSRVLLDMCIAGEESCASWSELIGGLVKRNMKAPVLAVIDGN